MGLRHRREERREERQVFGRGGTATRYQMRQKILSIGDDYWIENAEASGSTASMARRSGSGTHSTSRTPTAPSCVRSRPASCTSATPWTSMGRTASAWPGYTRH